MSRGAYKMTSPCDNCPFRTDVVPYIRPERVREIEAGLVRAEFPCHKTVDYSQCEHDDEGSHHIPTAGEVHCAGALILLEKLERPSQMMRIAERIGMYDARKLDMNAPVYDSFDEMFRAAKRRKRSKVKS